MMGGGVLASPPFVRLMKSNRSPFSHIGPDSARRMTAEAVFVRRLAGSLLTEPADADDLAQDTFLAALQSPPRAMSRSWLRRVLQTGALKRFRDRKTYVQDTVELELDGLGPDQLADRNETVELVRAEVERLPVGQREVVNLLYFKGLSAAQTARDLGLPLETVRTRRRVALARLRGRLDRVPGGRSAWVPALMLLFERPSTRQALGFGAAAVTTVALLGVGVGFSYLRASDGTGSDTLHPSTVEPALTLSLERGEELAQAADSSTRSPVTLPTSAAPAAEDESVSDRDLVLEEVPGPRFLQGRVTDEQGLPVGGARVLASASRMPTVFATADGDGRYEGEIPPGMDWIGCSASGFETPLAMHRLDPSIVTGRRGRLDFVLPRQTRPSFEGLVVDSHGLPVPDAEVQLFYDYDYKDVFLGSKPVRRPAIVLPTFTGARGRFLLEPVEGLGWTLRVSKEGYASYQEGLRLAGPPERIVLELPRSLSGTIRLPGGEPAAGARVVVRDAHDVLHHTTSDEWGEYVLDELPTGRLEVSARWSEGRSSWKCSAVVDPEDISARLSSELVAQEGLVGALFGPGAEPLDGHVVALAGSDWRGVRTTGIVHRPSFEEITRTGRDGGFEFAITPDRGAALFVRTPAGHWELLADEVSEARSPLIVDWSPASGRVRGRLSEPSTLDGATLWACSERWLRPRRVEVGDQGSFDVDGVPAGGFHLLFWSSRFHPVEIAGGDLSPRGVLDLGSVGPFERGKLNVRVVRENGEPISIRVSLLEIAAESRSIDFVKAKAGGMASFEYPKQGAREGNLYLEIGGVRRAALLQRVPPSVFERAEPVTIVLSEDPEYHFLIRLPHQVQPVDSFRFQIFDEKDARRILQVRPYLKEAGRVVSFRVQLPDGIYSARCEVGSHVTDFEDLTISAGQPGRLELSMDQE